MEENRKNLHPLELVQYSRVWIFGFSRGIPFDELLDVCDGPPTSEHSNDQPDKQNHCGNDSTFVTTESSSTIWAGMIRRVLFALHDMSIGITIVCL